MSSLWKEVVERGSQLQSEYDRVETKLYQCTLRCVILLEHLNYTSWWEELPLYTALDTLAVFLQRRLPREDEFPKLSLLQEAWLSLRATVSVFHPVISTYGEIEKLAQEESQDSVTEYEALALMEKALDCIYRVLASMNTCMEKALGDSYMLVEHMAIAEVRKKRQIQEFFQCFLLQIATLDSSTETQFYMWILGEIYQEKYLSL